MASGIVEPSQSGSSQEKNSERTPANIPRQRLVQKLMAAGSDLPKFINDLIEMQGMIVAGTEAAAFIVEPGQEQNQFSLRPIAHVRPDESSPEVRNKALEAFADIVRPCVEQGKDGVVEVASSHDDKIDPQFCLVTLLRAENQIVAVSAVVARATNIQRAQQRLSSMELVGGYFEIFTLKRANEQAKTLSQTNQNVLQLATTVATAEGFDSASMALCNELAARTGATRVAIGWVVGNKIKLKAMSHTEKFDKKQELSVQIIAAMEECLDQEQLVQFEPDGASSDNVTRAASELSRTQGGVSVLSLPLRRIGDVVGVVTLEFNPQKKLGPNAATSLAVAVELLAPQLYDRYQNDRWWITKTGLSIRETAKMVTGPKHMLGKVIVGLLILGLLFVTFYKPMYHVTAPFAFATTEKRIVSAPIDGFIGTVVKVRPGDTVKAGDVLLEMDTRDLVIKKTQASAQQRAKEIEAQRLRNDPSKTAESLQAMEEAKSAQADADFYASQIDHAIVKAPIDGIVLSGDWMDKRRSPVRKGDELFKVGQNENLRIELSVAERDIQWLKVPDPNNPQKGWLATTSLPGEKLPFVVDRVIPLPVTQEGGNTFKVYGTPEKMSGQWREGMQGEARIEVAHKPLGWIWTHRFFEWVRLKTWW